VTVRRDQILDWQQYEARRGELRREVLEHKRRRRVHLGDVLTFLFENEVTMRDQIQEMVRLEQLEQEADIADELDTYNAILGGPGELAATLLIELPDPDLRARKLAEWIDLPRHVYVELDDGTRVPATFDEAQMSDERLSSVQYIKFDTGGRVPAAVGTDLPELTVRVALSDEVRAALREDLTH